MNRLVLAGCFASSFGGLAWGQEGPRRVSLSMTAQAAWGGPASVIESGLRSAGYDDRYYACLSDLCVGPVSHPHSAQLQDPFDTWTFALRYQHDRRLGASLLAARTPLQTTSGFKSDDPAQPGFLGSYADVRSEVTVVAALVTFGTADQAWVGVGPSVNAVKLRDEVLGRSSAATTFGVVTEGGVRWPRASRIFLEMKAQYRWVASTEMSRLEFAPPARLSASHATVAAGLGLRFGSRIGRPGS